MFESDPSFDTAMQSGSFFEDEEWLSAKKLLQSKGAEFTRLYEQVLASRPGIENNPVLLTEYENLINRADIIKKGITAAAGGVDIIFPFINPITSIFDYFFGKSETGLGVGPLIPLSIAAITGFIAAIAYWITDATKFLAKTTGEVVTSPNFLIIGVGILALLILTRKRSTT